MNAKADIKAAVIAAALTQAEQLGWAHVTLKDIAEGAKVSLADLHDHFEDKFDILAGIERTEDLGRTIDRAQEWRVAFSGCVETQ